MIKLLRILAVSLILPGGVGVAQAQSGVWTNDASSVWSVATNWLNGAVGNGIDATADFSTINITANRTNILDTSRTIGSLSIKASHKVVAGPEGRGDLPFENLNELN